MTTKRRTVTTQRVNRPKKPGRAIYTAIIGAHMSVGELCAMVDMSKGHFVKVLKGRKDLTPRQAYLLGEIFGYDRAERWYLMQARCQMFECGVRERSKRKVLGEDTSEYDAAWEEHVRNSWRDNGLLEKEDRRFPSATEEEMAEDRMDLGILDGLEEDEEYGEEDADDTGR